MKWETGSFKLLKKNFCNSDAVLWAGDAAHTKAGLCKMSKELVRAAQSYKFLSTLNLNAFYRGVTGCDAVLGTKTVVSDQNCRTISLANASQCLDLLVA